MSILVDQSGLANRDEQLIDVAGEKVLLKMLLIFQRFLGL